MSRSKKNIVYFFLSIIVLSCIEPYEHNFIGETENSLLVVDAILTNEIKTHTVKLSYTSSLESEDLILAKGATVTIESENGEIVNLTESLPGNYVTDSTYAGMIGESYMLRVITENGNEYLSTKETLNEAPPIDSLYGRYVQLPSKESGDILNGVQIFLVTDWQNYEVSTFRYTWEETYEWRVPYPSYYLWDETSEKLILRTQSVDKCFRQETSSSLIMGSGIALNNQKLTEFPVHFINEADPNLAYKTAVHVKQYALSASTYQFYKRLQDNNESGGSLFDKQKGNIVGNMGVLTGPRESVLGNFEVSGVSSKLVFFVPKTFVPDGFNIPLLNAQCNLIYRTSADSIPTSGLADYFSSSASAGKGIWAFFMPEPPGFYVILSEPCTDCRINGDIEIPTFWE
jgi:hypothetical protein